MPANYKPKTETEKALLESLRQMELQCKERVDLLEALKQSREEAAEKSKEPSDNATISNPNPFADPGEASTIRGGTGDTAAGVGWMGNGTVRPLDYPDLARPPPPLPKRPSMPSPRPSSMDMPRPKSTLRPSLHLDPNSLVTLPIPDRQKSRTPSPDRKQGMLRTLRPGRKPVSDSSSAKMQKSLRSRPPAAAKAATQAWGVGGSSSRPEAERLNSLGLSTDAARSSVLSFSQQTPSKDSLGRSIRLGSIEDNGLTHVISESPKESARLPKLSPAVLSYRSEYPESATARQVDSKTAVERARRRHGHSRTSNNRSSGQRKSRVEPESPHSQTANMEDEEDERLDGSSSSREERSSKRTEKDRIDRILKKLPKGVDQDAAKQILNEIVVHGDEVHWDDIAGLEIAKDALKETVVYPFLRPDLFSGLREPARGMLLFGPPGTGKTMLARAVATESRSTFFAISASSLTSKWLGESEKLVRALFALAKVLAPSIIFVDEIDSLLSDRGGGGEQEATRRIKTEFLIQWSDLARAAAGRESSRDGKDGGDASRVLVLAATNLPWAIDEAARRRFVRRQYIPLPEPHVRMEQLRTLLSHQKHSLTERDLNTLVVLTEGKLLPTLLLSLAIQSSLAFLFSL
jgi:fidgetin-like protein 1